MPPMKKSNKSMTIVGHLAATLRVLKLILEFINMLNN